MDGLQRGIATRAKNELAATLGRATVGRARGDAIVSLSHAYRNWALRHPGRYAAAQRVPAPGDTEMEAADWASVEIIGDVPHLPEIWNWPCRYCWPAAMMLAAFLDHVPDRYVTAGRVFPLAAGSSGMRFSRGNGSVMTARRRRYPADAAGYRRLRVVEQAA